MPVEVGNIIEVVPPAVARSRSAGTRDSVKVVRAANALAVSDPVLERDERIFFAVKSRALIKMDNDISYPLTNLVIIIYIYITTTEKEIADGHYRKSNTDFPAVYELRVYKRYPL